MRWLAPDRKNKGKYGTPQEYLLYNMQYSAAGIHTGVMYQPRQNVLKPLTIESDSLNHE